MSQQTVEKQYDVGLATEDLSENGYNLYILTSRGQDIGFYMANSDVNNHQDLMREFGFNDRNFVDEAGLLEFSEEDVRLIPNSGTDKLDDLPIEYQKNLDDPILEYANQATDLDYELENVLWG